MANLLPLQPIGKSSSDLTVSRLALGCMGMAGTWEPSEIGPENVRKAIAAFEAALEVGIDFFDHADIYGQGGCETVFKECLAAVPGIRDKIVIATKCGINIGHGYNLSADYIRGAAEASMSRMGIDYIDIYQMHRPDPLAHPRETASALRELVQSGKVRYVGVSNYYPEQVRALQHYLGDGIPLVSNQIEISLLRLGPIYEGWFNNDMTSDNGLVGDGVLDQCEMLEITPLAWSPLGRGFLSGAKDVPADNPRKLRIDAILRELNAQAEKYNATPGNVALAWLLAHPSGIIPLVGSNNPEHIKEAAECVKIDMSRDDWYKLWVAAWGRDWP